MHNDPPTLQCPNYLCQALNPESHQFCHNCRTLLPKRYLWAVGVGLEAVRPGTRIHDRYWLKQHQILLDTKPGMLADLPAEISPTMEPYLRLFSHRLQVPQIYGVVKTNQGATKYILLEQAPIYPAGAVSETGVDLGGKLMPGLIALWKQSSGLRQLNWLWQMAQLWQPLSSEKVTSTLLHPELLRVDGGCVRLRELAFDGKNTPTLAHLGQLWSQWQPQADPAIADFLAQICQEMIQEHIKTSEHLLTFLDQGLEIYSRGQARQIQIATSTDQGPSRQSNEDACYPPSGTHLAIDPNRPQIPPFAIVCDGIGGHEGGEVASYLAIQTVTQETQNGAIAQQIPDPIRLTHRLEDAVFDANDVISQQNDVEQRQERQRMGTTIVMGLARAHELFITHVGDSRAYRITRTGCYQVTLDDDVASREVRLGYTLYRDALQHPSAGSLVQALGMGSSTYLHPTVQRFIVDEDCIFLLCSDGLSDNDRIEECWQTEIVPILDHKIDLVTAAQTLIEIANTRNGHDNVTVGLMYCQVSTHPVSAGAQRESVPQSVPAASEQPTQLVTPATTLQPEIGTSTARTQVMTRPPASRRWLSIGLTLLGLLGIGGLLAFLLVPELGRNLNLPSSTSPTVKTPAPPDIPVPASPTILSVNSVVRLERPSSPANPAFLPLLQTAENPVGSTPPQIVGAIPPGSVLQIIGRQAGKDQTYWTRLRVCSVAPTPVKQPQGIDVVKEGQTGWQQETTIAPLISQNFSLKPDQLGACTPSSPSPQSSESNLKDNVSPAR